MPISLPSLNPLSVGSDFSDPYRLRDRPAVRLPSPLDPLQPLAGDDPDHVGKVLLALPAPLLDREQAHGCGRPDGVLAVVRHTPARAAISAMVRSQCPFSRTSSVTIRRAASSPTVNLQATDGGIGPEAARCRRRAMATDRRGGRWRRLGGKMDGRPGGMPTGFTSPLTTRRRAWIRLARSCAWSSVTALAPQPCQMARDRSSSLVSVRASLIALAICSANMRSPSDLMDPSHGVALHSAKLRRCGK